MFNNGSVHLHPEYPRRWQLVVCWIMSSGVFFLFGYYGAYFGQHRSPHLQVDYRVNTGSKFLNLAVSEMLDADHIILSWILEQPSPIRQTRLKQISRSRLESVQRLRLAWEIEDKLNSFKGRF